jgi:hypothetical protein
MKRTTLYLEPDLELLLRTEMVRRNASMATLIREALRAYLRGAAKAPPGGGAFASRRRGTASNAEKILKTSGFGQDG